MVLVDHGSSVLMFSWYWLTMVLHVWCCLSGVALTLTSRSWRTEQTAGPLCCWRSTTSSSKLLSGLHHCPGGDLGLSPTDGAVPPGPPDLHSARPCLAGFYWVWVSTRWRCQDRLKVLPSVSPHACLTLLSL